MSLLLPLGILVAALALINAAFLLRGGKSSSRLDFSLKARKAGFERDEPRRLWEAAKRAGLKDPAKLLSSRADLDRVLAILGVDGAPRSPEIARFLEKLYELRRNLEIQGPRSSGSITSSRMLAPGQRFKLLIHGLGVFESTLVDSNPRFLVLSYPIGAKVPQSFVWKGKKVSAYFWRRDDAGYVFDTFVLDDLRVKEIPVIHLAHSESLFRTQKRKSVRVRTAIPAYLYVLKRIEGAFERPEPSAGLKARIVDLSEDGFAVTIGGKAKPGMLVKVQFELSDRQIVMSGNTRSVDFDSDKNRSVLHVQAVPPSQKTRNALRSYVYAARASGNGAGTEAAGRAAGVP